MRDQSIYLREGEQVSRSVKWSAPEHSSLVGRQQEMAEAIRHLEESLKGNGRTVFVVGETGSGKSKLLSELGKYAEAKGVLFLRGRCLYQENAESASLLSDCPPRPLWHHRPNFLYRLHSLNLHLSGRGFLYLATHILCCV